MRITFFSAKGIAVPIDGASRTLPAIRVSARVGTGAPDPTVHGPDGARDKLSARASRFSFFLCI
jgi:hypothetical protein